MDLSIIILNYKTKGLVKQCVRNAKSAVGDLNYEIIVVDNGSGDGCGEMIKENFSDVKFLPLPKNIGFAAGNNAGIKIALGEYIMLLNPDVTALEGSILKMVDFMKAHAEVGLVGPKLINADGSYQISCRTFQTPKLILYRRTPLGNLKAAAKELRDHLMADFDHRSNRPVDWVMGACMLVRKSALEKVGLLDERFFFYVEDMDWCRRFWEKGFKVYYLAETEMVHLYERASAVEGWKFWTFNKMTRRHIASWFKYFAKYFGVKNNAQS
ncbi:MAG: glycosyltransferase family 2 protein [Patescibacteria group bacterium]|nr:glycosyltransferase family 2 protein [Patescibacteria group bacterium]